MNPHAVKILSSFLIVALFVSGVGCQLLSPGGGGGPAVTSPAVASPQLSDATPALEETTKPALEDTPAVVPFDPGQVTAPTAFQTRAEFADAALTGWQPPDQPAAAYDLPFDLIRLANISVVDGLTREQADFLSQNGFVVAQTGESQFGEIRRQVSLLYGQPYFLTTDAAFHAVHQDFDGLLKALEAQQFRPRLVGLLSATLAEVQSWQDQAAGTSLEEDVQRAEAYLAVALRLLDPAYELDPQVQEVVSRQVDQIMAESGRERSVLFPDFEDDYGAYRPVSHYAGTAALESYFRAMTWLGRVHFKLQDDDPAFRPSRLPLVITLALQQAETDGIPAAEEWTRLHEALTFLVGPSDDGGPAEYAALMAAVYGPDPGPADLAEEALWEQFLAHADRIPAPRINSTFVDSLDQLPGERGWRFLGQRFTFDAYILQNLVYTEVGTQEKPRELPSGLDVMAALGSQPALDALEAAGETGYLNYPQQMARLQASARQQSQQQWLSTFYGGWLFAFLPQVVAKDSVYPPFMRTPAWGYKELNSALGSWTELKHDTVLYGKMPEFAGGGGPPSSPPAPGYVEPNPDVFYRLAAIVGMLSQGLLMRGMDQPLAEPLPDDLLIDAGGLPGWTARLEGFAQQLTALGGIAEREIAGETLKMEDNELIQSCLGTVECRVEWMQRMHRFGVGPDMEMPPVPVVAAVAGAKDRVLEAAVGSLERIYVLVPLEGSVQAAQGGVFSYYEFAQPRTDRLTDETWRERLASDPPARPAWVEGFSLPGGQTADALAFRVGDVYIVTEEGADLNLRIEPDTRAAVLQQFQPGDYLEIVAGPIEAGGYTWWQVGTRFDGTPSGWVVEEPEWYERSWGQ